MIYSYKTLGTQYSLNELQGYYVQSYKQQPMNI